MEVMGIDIGQIVTLGTQVSTIGSMQAMAGGELWELLIGIAILIYEIDPNFP